MPREREREREREVEVYLTILLVRREVSRASRSRSYGGDENDEGAVGARVVQTTYAERLGFRV